MHLTLKMGATRPAASNVLQQQMGFDTFRHRFNQERPHQALAIATPASRYTPSTRQYQGLEELDYPFHDWTDVVTRSAASVISAAKSISARCLPDRRWA